MKNMKRKVIKQGNGTLTITLPKQWCNKLNLSGGEDIEVTEMENNLVINKFFSKTEQKVSVDVSNLDRSTILMIIQSLYRYGYDIIEIISTDTMVFHHRIGKKINLSKIVYNAANRMVGAEVISTSKKRYVIKRLAEESINEFSTILRRVFLLLNEMIELFVESIEKNDLEGFKSIEFHHSNIKKFIKKRQCNYYQYSLENLTISKVFLLFQNKNVSLIYEDILT